MMTKLPKQGNLELVFSLSLVLVFSLATGSRKRLARITDLSKFDWNFSNWTGSHNCSKLGVSLFIIIFFFLSFQEKQSLKLK